MKVVLTVLALTFSLSSFAALIKTDSGAVFWTVNVNKKKDGVLKYVRARVQMDGSNSSSPEELRMATQITFSAGVGGTQEIPMTFEVADERSQESVEAKIIEISAKDIERFPVTSKDAQVKLSNLNCVETGFLKKKLNCRADFEIVQTIELKN